MMMGPGPAVNQLPTPRATLKVSNIPSFVTSDDFSRLMLQLEGCVDARLLGRQPGGDQVGYGEFSDKMNASKAKNLYHGWTGWGGRGLAIELTDFPMAQRTQGIPGQKRMREGDDLLQPGNNYKQARPDMPAMGGGTGGGMASGVSNSQPSMHQPGPQQDVGGLLQNLSNVTSLLQQQGIAQQLLAAAQQVSSGASMAQPQQQVLSMLSQGSQQPLGGSGMTGSGAMGHGAGGGYVSEPYNPAAVGPSSSLQQQPRQQMGSMMGGGGGSLMPQQQQPMQHFHEPAMQQGGAGYMGGPPMQQQPMMQGPPQQQYGIGPQVQPQMMQPSMGPGGDMVPSQQPQMMPQQLAQQGMMQPGPQQGMAPSPGPGPGMHRGDVMAAPPMRQYPPDACNTLYIEGLPADVTRRELAHIFRATEGFRSLRLVIKDSKKHAGEKLVMAFAEYTNTYFATEAMDKLQGYPFDLDDPEALNFFIKYARPMTGGRLGGAAPSLHRGPPGGRGAPDLGVPRGPPPRLGSRGGGMMMEGRGRGGRGGGRFGPGGPPRLRG